MFYKKIFSFIIGFVFFTVNIQTVFSQSVPYIVKWSVEKNSSLSVKGKSNVNNFTCNIKEYGKRDTIICVNDPAQPVKLIGAIEMEILSFNCHSNLITKDLRKTLKADEYPTMIIHFLSLANMPVLKDKTESIDGWVEVELAGVVKRFMLHYSFVKSEAGILLDGGRTFCFSDFKLSPPKKLAGMVKIKDEFDVNFRLILRAI
ncbi:MAG: hypothetical protein JWN76_3215 [Chitinophagaceae bacterium]|nr:hypothetical protein [Chitinophagaceae bacterium]